MATKKQAAPAAETNLNMQLWSQIEHTDPKFVKAITGKAYKGNSPHPTWLIKRLTEVLGPCGIGFGWRVVHEQYLDGTPHRVMTGPETASVVREQMHELRIEFWHKDIETGEIGTFESYGSTKAFYLSNNNKWIHDEDVGKKSLTDAVVKAISFIGGASDIFLGRWDDNKYVETMKAHFGNADNAFVPQIPSGVGAQKALMEPSSTDEQLHAETASDPF